MKFEPQSEAIAAKLGYAADPAIEMLLPQEVLWQVKVRKIELAVAELESTIGVLNQQMEMLNMQKDMLEKHYRR